MIVGRNGVQSVRAADPDIFQIEEGVQIPSRRRNDHVIKKYIRSLCVLNERPLEHLASFVAPFGPNTAHKHAKAYGYKIIAGAIVENGKINRQKCRVWLKEKKR